MDFPTCVYYININTANDSNIIFLIVCWREVLDGKVWSKLGPLHDWAVLLKETYNLQKPLKT